MQKACSACECERVLVLERACQNLERIFTDVAATHATTSDIKIGALVGLAIEVGRDIANGKRSLPAGWAAGALIVLNLLEGGRRYQHNQIYKSHNRRR